MLKYLLFLAIIPLLLIPAFADHTEVTIEPIVGSGTPGCEETPEGCFMPMTATVDVGGLVIFSNTDSAAHTFTSGEATDADSVGAIFDSSLTMAGSSFEWTPTEAGDVPYFCIVHPWMEGIIIVGDGISLPIQTNSLTITTDKPSYSQGETISITGQTPTTYNGQLNISLSSSTHGLLDTMYNVTTNNNQFATSMSTGNNTSIQTAETYTLTAIYGTDTASTTFHYAYPIDGGGEYFIPDSSYLILSDHEIDKWNGELIKWQNAQNRTDSKIEFYYEKLDAAITRNQTDKIETYTERIGHSMALSELYDGLIECLQEQLELLS